MKSPISSEYVHDHIQVHVVHTCTVCNYLSAAAGRQNVPGSLNLEKPPKFCRTMVSILVAVRASSVEIGGLSRARGTHTDHVKLWRKQTVEIHETSKCHLQSAIPSFKTPAERCLNPHAKDGQTDIISR